jgi:hypothetical protein
MKLTVNDIKFELSDDIDVSRRVDVKEIDSLVFACVEASKDALQTAPPNGYSDLERHQLSDMVDGLRHSHSCIRKILSGDQNAVAVDALTISRLQLETLYSFCFLLQSPENVRWYLRAGWKKKYIRYILHRAECRNLSRFDEFFGEISGPYIDGLQRVCFVSDDERRTIDYQELNEPFGPEPRKAVIPDFPTPMKVIERISDPGQAGMLKRLYPEYRFLCSFAHGDSEAALFRNLANTRSIASRMFSTGQIEDFYQKQILEPPIFYSALSATQVATELAAVYPSNVELLVKVTKAWNFLLGFHLLASTISELRSKRILPLVS